jgi:histidinol dehydrogenase
MLKYFQYNKKISKKKLTSFLEKRKFNQNNESLTVKKIIYDIKKNGDKAVIKYEKKFSKIKIKSPKIYF